MAPPSIPPPMPPMAQEWYYAKDATKLGPVSFEQLKEFAASGDLQPDDLTWTKGEKEWQPAKLIQDLFPENTESKTSPPALPLPVGAEQPIVSTFRLSLVRGGKYAAMIGGVAGFTADFLRPLGPFNGYLALLAAFCSVIFFLLWRRLAADIRSRWDCPFPHQAMIFSIYLLLAFGFWLVAANLNETGNNGALAGNVTLFATLQETLLGIKSDVQEIKTTTGEILSETKKISGDIEELEDLGGLVKEPTTPADYYHNARIHELNADFRQAFDAYEHYLSFNQPFVDPIESYLAIVKTQNGYRAAVQTFDELKSRFPSSKAIELVSIRLQTGKDRLDSLQQFVRSNAEFGPALLDLANFYSAAELPSRSGIDIEREQRYLTELLEAADKGDFYRYMLDKKLANSMLDDARGRLIASEDVSSTFRSSKKVILANRNQIWVMDNTAKNIFYSFDQEEWHPVTQLVVTVILCRGSIPDPRIRDPSLEFVYVKYVDQRSQESQVFTIDIKSMKKNDPPKGLGDPINPFLQ